MTTAVSSLVIGQSGDRLVRGMTMESVVLVKGLLVHAWRLLKRFAKLRFRLLFISDNTFIVFSTNWATYQHVRGWPWIQQRWSILVVLIGKCKCIRSRTLTLSLGVEALPYRSKSRNVLAHRLEIQISLRTWPLALHLLSFEVIYPYGTVNRSK